MLILYFLHGDIFLHDETWFKKKKKFNSLNNSWEEVDFSKLNCPDWQE